MPLTTKHWYVNGDTVTPVNWSTAVVNGVATIDIDEITLRSDQAHPDRWNWANKNTQVPGSAVTQAQALQDGGAVPQERFPGSAPGKFATPAITVA